MGYSSMTRGFDQTREAIESAHEAEEDRLATIERLKVFYAVVTLEDLVLMQAQHVRKLQAKLPPLRDERPGYVPREG